MALGTEQATNTTMNTAARTGAKATTNKLVDSGAVDAGSKWADWLSGGTGNAGQVLGATAAAVNTGLAANKVMNMGDEQRTNMAKNPVESAAFNVGAMPYAYTTPTQIATAGLVNSAVAKNLGLGKYTPLGYDIKSSAYNSGTPASMQYVSGQGLNNYKTAMDYLNNYNLGINNDWNAVGDWDQGDLKLKGRELSSLGYMASAAPSAIDNTIFGGMPISQAPVYGLSYTGVGRKLFGKKSEKAIDAQRINNMTGYNVLDDYTNSKLNQDFNQYANHMQDLYTGKYNNTSDKLMDAQDQAIYDAYGLGNAGNAVEQANNQQLAEAQQKLANLFNTGHLDRASYMKSLDNLNKQAIENKKNLYDIANAQSNNWKDQINQLWARDTGVEDKDWVKNYDIWNANRGGDMTQAFDKANDTTQGFKNNFINDAYYQALLNNSNSFTPYSAILDSYKNSPDVIDNSLQDWRSLLSSGKKRKAESVYTGE